MKDTIQDAVGRIWSDCHSGHNINKQPFYCCLIKRSMRLIVAQKYLKSASSTRASYNQEKSTKGGKKTNTFLMWNA